MVRKEERLRRSFSEGDLAGRFCKEGRGEGSVWAKAGNAGVKAKADLTAVSARKEIVLPAVLPKFLRCSPYHKTWDCQAEAVYDEVDDLAYNAGAMCEAEAEKLILSHWVPDVPANAFDECNNRFRGCWNCGSFSHWSRECKMARCQVPRFPCKCCGSPQHYVRDCPVDKLKPKCFQCGKRGHKAFACTKRGYGFADKWLTAVLQQNGDTLVVVSDVEEQSATVVKCHRSLFYFNVETCIQPINYSCFQAGHIMSECTGEYVDRDPMLNDYLDAYRRYRKYMKERSVMHRNLEQEKAKVREALFSTTMRTSKNGSTTFIRPGNFYSSGGWRS